MVSNPQHEPTMEEILASIRKIISEDSTEGQPAPAEAKPAPAPEPVAEAESDVLQLTPEEVVEEAPVAAAPAPAPEPISPIAPPPENDVVFEPIEPEPAPVAAEAPAPSSDIFSDKTRKAVDDAFAGIDTEDEGYAEPARTSRSVSVDGLSVEAVFERAVREAFEPVVNKWLGDNADDVVARMKPLIREWMDEHFPALLEGAVRDEVARVARARGSKR